MNQTGCILVLQSYATTPCRPLLSCKRQWRITSWRDRQAPEGDAFSGDPRNWEKTRYQTAELSPLGRKLLGLDRW